MGRYPHLRRFQLEADEDREIAMNAMVRVDVDQFADRSLHSLSGGERQRVLLARALAQRTQLIFVDEPTSSLDVKHQLLALQTLKDETINRGVSVCIIMHDLSLAARYCDQLVLLHQGEVAAVGTPTDVITEQNIRRTFEVVTSIRDDETGRPQVSLVSASEEWPTDVTPR